MQIVPGQQEPATDPAEQPAAPPEDFLNLDIDIGPMLPEPMQPLWDFMQAYPVLLVVAMAALGYIVGKVIQWALESVLAKAANRTETKLDDKLAVYLTQPVVHTTVILGLVAAAKAFEFSEGLDWFLVRLAFTLLLFLWGRAWFKATALAISSMTANSQRFKLFEPRTRPLFDMGIKILLLSILLWLFMALWNIDGTAWLASAGVIGIAVGFAAKDTLANLISGVSIIADAPYKIGDYIILDTGERGAVTHLGMRSTRLLTRDDVEISIPNAVMGNAKITNESGGPTIEHRIRVPIGVAYGTPPAKVVEVLERVAAENDMMLSYPEPRVRMRAFADSSINFELMGWIRLPEQRGLVRHQLLMAIEEAFREAAIQIPFPQLDLHVQETGTAPAADDSASSTAKPGSSEETE